ncbi:TPA: tail fiber protein, partial [Escherichia coli]
QIIAEQIIPENEGGFWIREIGLYDDEGVLIAVANCPETYKPQLQEGSGRTQTIRMILVVTNTEAITLKIDPSVVLATRKYVDDKISEHEQSRRHPDASLTVKGFTQLSSAINSESETLAATPKAVKAAYDLANAKYTAQNATTTQKGIVQLSSDTNSTSETLAATPKAVKAAYDLAAGKAPSSHTHPWNQITGVPTASLTAKGITQLSSATNSTSEVLAATPKAVKAAYDLANGKYTAQDATTTQKGIVQLSSATNSTSEVLAATPKAVKAAYDLANRKQAADATLTALAALATAADKLPYFTGVDRAALTALTSVGRAILSKPSIQGVLNYLGLGEGAPAIGVPFFWPSAAMPDTVIDSWSSMVFLKFNGAKFSATDYPVLAKVFPALALPDARGDFIRIWDDGRGIDVGRTLLSGQSHTIMDHAHNMELWTGDGLAAGSTREGVNPGILATYGDGGIVKTDEPGLRVPSSLRAISSRSVKRYGEISGHVGTETRPRNIAFNFLVRAK